MRILAEKTGQSIEQISKDTDRDNFMSADAGSRIWPDRQGFDQPHLTREVHAENARTLSRSGVLLFMDISLRLGIFSGTRRDESGIRR